MLVKMINSTTLTMKKSTRLAATALSNLLNVEVRGRCRRWSRLTAWIIASVGVLASVPGQAGLVDLYTGTSNYSIPIVTPPGTNGAGPNLSLQYSSGGGDDTGWIGDGWSLAGLGYIERRGPGNAVAPSYNDTNDTFVLHLNGSQKLVYTGADPATGAVGKYYRTEIDNHFKIELIGTWNSSDYYWLATDKDGTRYTFGRFEDSRDINPGPYTHRWHLNQVTDTHGVSWSINYRPYNHSPTLGEGVIRIPLGITYSTDSGGNCIPVNVCRTVSFIHKDRTVNVSTSYATGAPITRNKLLSSVEVRLGAQLVRRYTLGHTPYSNAPARGRIAENTLTSIIETVADGTTNLPATTFTYNPDANGASLVLAKSPTMAGSPPENLGSLTLATNADNCTISLDLDHDRFSDVITGNGGNWYYQKNSGANGFTKISIANPAGTALPSLCSTRKEKRKKNAIADAFDCIRKNLMNLQYGGDSEGNTSVHGGGGSNACKSHEMILSLHDTTLTDIDGDGLPDIVYSPSAYQWTWWRNLGNGVFGTQKGIGGAPSSSLADPGVRFVDMDGDGLEDVVNTKATCAGKNLWNWQIIWWRNQGEGNFSPSPVTLGTIQTAGFPNVTDVSSSSCKIIVGVVFSSCAFTPASASDGLHVGFSFVDVNGDGLVDVLWDSWDTTGGDMSYWPILQGGTRLGSRTNVVNSQGAKLTRHGPSYFADMNSDGVVDVLVGEGTYTDNCGALQNQPSNYYYYPSVGNGIFGAAITLTNSPENRLARAQHLTLSDMNGDGFPDILRGEANSYSFYSLNYSDSHQNLETATNPLGGVLTFGYQRLIDTNTVRWVTKSYTQNDGLGLSGTTTVSFYGGLFKGWPHNEFRGYQLAILTDPAGFTSSTRFHQDDSRKGLVEMAQVWTGLPLRASVHTINDYSILPLTTGVTQVLLSSQVVNTYPFNPADATKTVSTAYGDYDNYGNPHRVITSGSDITTRVVTTDYAHNTSAYIVNRPSRTDTRINSASGTKISETWFDYDGQSNGVFPTKGDLTKETHWLSGGTNPVTLYAYDAFGNRIGTTDPAGNICATTGYASAVEYDATYKTFPVKTTNALCQVTSKNYWGVDTTLSASGVSGAYAFPGLLARVTDPNATNSDIYYDVFGRVRATVVPPDTTSAPTTVIDYNVTGTAPSSTKTSKRENTGGGVLVGVTYSDGLGRIIQSKTEAETAGQWVTQDTFYNNRGLVDSVSIPYKQ